MAMACVVIVRKEKSFKNLTSRLRMKSLVVLLFVLWCTEAVFGAAYFSEIQKEIVYGKTVRFCVYKDLRLLPHSVIKDYDACTKCTCTKKGLSCVTMTFGFKTTDDSKCVAVTIGCKNRWVLKRNKNRHCPRKFLPKQMSAVGK